MKIQSLELKNFRCFEDIRITLHDQLTVLVGLNGSGKTAISEAIHKLFSFLIGSRDITNINIDSKSEHNLRALKMYNSEECSKIDKEKYASLLSFDIVFDEKEYSVDSNSANQLDFKSIYRHGTRVVFRYYKSIRGLRINTRYDADVAGTNFNFSDSLVWFESVEAEEAKHAVKIKDLNFKIPALEAVRQAISSALGEYENPYTSREPLNEAEFDDKTQIPPDFFIYKKNAPDIPYRISQLSDGYRTMLALIMDLARRMATTNAERYSTQGKSILESPAIVLIDEVELHLHPSWQQTVLPSLMTIFPNTQFIVTTHSPQVVSSVEPQHVRILKDGKVLPVETSTFGAESSRVLEEIFGVSVRPPNVAIRTLDEYLKLINDGAGHSTEAKALRVQLDNWLADDPILDRADMFITRSDRQKAREEKTRA